MHVETNLTKCMKDVYGENSKVLWNDIKEDE